MAKKINYEQNTIINFKEIRVGEIFYYNNFIFIRTEASFDNNICFNVVCLNDGSFDYFEETDGIIKVDAEINIKFV